MRIKRWTTCVTIIGIAAIAILAGPLAINLTSSDTKKNQEQSKFGAEEVPIVKPVPVPDGILQDLKTSVLYCLQYYHLDSVPTSWVEASQIHLDGPNEADLVVQGVGGCFLGANITSFWIYRETSQGFELALDLHVHDLEVLRSKSRGFREIRTWTMTAGIITTITFRFDGKSYQMHRKVTKPIG